MGIHTTKFLTCCVFQYDLIAGAQKLLLGLLGSVSLFCQELQLLRCYFLHSLASATPYLLGVVFMI